MYLEDSAEGGGVDLAGREVAWHDLREAHAGGGRDGGHLGARALVVEHDARALLAGAASAAGAVDVAFDLLGDAALDDEVDVGDVDAARRHVGRNQHLELTLAEALENRLARRLRDVAVQRGAKLLAAAAVHGRAGAAAGGVEARLEVRREGLGVGEDDGAAGVRVGLDEGADDDGHVVDAGGHRGRLVRDERGRLARGRRRRAVDEDRVARVLLRDAVDPRRHGGREEDRLAVAGRVGEDALDVLREANAEHLVSLVEHDVARRGQVEHAALDVVLEAAGGRNHDIDAARQRAHLTVVGRAAVHGAHREVGVQALDLAGDLVSELAGGLQDEDGRRVRGRARVVGLHQGVDQRETEGERLARTGLGLADDVLALLDGAQHLGLCYDSFRKTNKGANYVRSAIIWI